MTQTLVGRLMFVFLLMQTKYPEAEAFLQRIHAAGGRTAHAINAVKIDVSAESHLSKLQPFKHVIFHHPHLGVESMHRHSALLGHFFHSATQECVLASRGVIHVSVGGRQAQDWRLHEQASRHGLVLLLQTVYPLSPLTSHTCSCHVLCITCHKLCYKSKRISKAKRRRKPEHTRSCHTQRCNTSVPHQHLLPKLQVYC